MELDLNVLRPQERASLQLRLLYEQEGFRKYHMGRFEEYGLYQENRRFLSSEQVITFTDLDGRLLALKPDVTLSIAKNAQVGPGGCGRYYYCDQRGVRRVAAPPQPGEPYLPGDQSDGPGVHRCRG